MLQLERPRVLSDPLPCRGTNVRLHHRSGILNVGARAYIYIYIYRERER